MREPLQHRGLRLFHLQEERVTVVAANHKGNPRPRPDAADADDLAGHLYETELVQQELDGDPLATFAGSQPATVAFDPRTPDFPLTRTVPRRARWSADCLHQMRDLPSTTVVSLLNASMLSRVFAFAINFSVRARPTLVSCDPTWASASSTLSREYHTSRLRICELPHAGSIGLRRGEYSLTTVLVEKATLPGGADLHARGETFHVPLPGRRQGLVKVVDVEDHRPLRRGEQTEVREVRVATRLHRQSGSRRGSQIRGHDQGRPTEKSEGRTRASCRTGLGPTREHVTLPALPGVPPDLA